MTFRTLVRPLFVALSLAFATTAAAPAFADGAEAKADAKPLAEAKPAKAKEHFPMTAEKFTKVVNKRLENAKVKLEEGIAKHKVSDTEKAKLMKEFDDGASLVRAAAKKAGSDGEVTRSEAKEVQTLVKALRHQLHAELTHKKSNKKTV